MTAMAPTATVDAAQRTFTWKLRPEDQAAVDTKLAQEAAKLADQIKDLSPQACTRILKSLPDVAVTEIGTKPSGMVRPQLNSNMPAARQLQTAIEAEVKTDSVPEVFAVLSQFLWVNISGQWVLDLSVTREN